LAAALPLGAGLAGRPARWAWDHRRDVGLGALAPATLRFMPGALLGVAAMTAISLCWRCR
jgi:hypothetical protein